jgi:hypothetical protein
MRWFWMLLIRLGQWGLGGERPRDERDKALIVGYLGAYRSSDVLSMKMKMEDYSRGQHDWSLRSEARIHRLLDQLEVEGAVTSQIHSAYGRVYQLRSPSSTLPVE